MNGDGDPEGLTAVSGGGGDDGNGSEPPRAQLTALPGAEEPAPVKPRLKRLRAALVILGLAVLALVSWIFGIMMAVAQDLPKLENRAQYERAENSVVLDRNGTRLATLTNNEGRILVESDEIAPVMKEAVVAVEDQRFYGHRGVDFQGIARALYQDVLSGSAQQGASTITQQFVKNALAAQQSRTIFQKLREAALAYQLERNWSKDKIITEYLNSIYFGEGAYGIEAAAQTFFGYAHEGCGDEGQPTCASELLPYEAALLAGIIASPDAYSPRANPVDAEARRDLVLQNMAEQGFITDDEFTSYSSRQLPGNFAISPPADDSASPYFTSWLRQQLVDKYGAGEAFGGGLEIKSTLDLELQQQVEAIAEATVSGVGLDSSVVVLDNETAGILAMVGRVRLRASAVQPRHQRPAPAGLLVQAVHARHRARAGSLDQRGVRLVAPVDPLPGEGREEERRDQDGQRAVRAVELRGQLPRLGLAGDRHHLFRQLRLRPARDAGRPGEHRLARVEDGHQHRPLDGERIRARGQGLRAVQPGPDPRWPRIGRHAARDGARLQHDRGERRTGHRHARLVTPRPRRHPRGARLGRRSRRGQGRQ